MATFLQGSELNSEIEKLIKNSNTELILISPYIKLHDRFKDELKSKKVDDNLKITVVFGKNEEEPSKSILNADLEFLKQFPNIEIRHEKRLHAKYYANESTQILSSMNLYDYSQDKNIEAGIKSEFKILGSTLEDDMQEYFDDVIERSDLLFRKIPNYEIALGGLKKKYKDSEIQVDKIEEFIKPLKSINKNKVQELGYCIRTGESIPFNIKKPYSIKAYESWSKFKNYDYAEKFCHKTGKASNGKTSMNKPIL